MGTLLLFLFSSLGYATWQVAESQSLFTIKSATLSFEPGNDVPRDTDVAVRCKVAVSSSSGTPLSRAYIIYKDNTVVYTKNTSSSDDLLYRLPQARVTNTGKYKCQVTIQDKRTSSNAEKLTVTGLSKPVLHLGKRVSDEGEQVTANCSAPGESGPFVFYFFENGKDIHDVTVNTNQVEVKLRFSNVGSFRVHCAYTVIMVPDSVKSNSSDPVPITVRALSFTPVLRMFPEPTKSKIFEGDRMNISCTVSGSFQNTSNLKLFLSNGRQLLSSGETKAGHSLLVFSDNPGEFECSLEMGNLRKRDVKTVKVHEIISTPVLSLQSEVFEKDRFEVKCHSAVLSPERVRDERDIRYEIFKDEALNGVRAPSMADSVPRAGTHNYTCRAQARNILKHSAKFTVRVKALASAPEISAVGRVVVGRPFWVRCRSDRGSLPITHTLWKKDVPVGMATVKTPFERAVFNLTVRRPEETGDYTCTSENNRRAGPVAGRPLNVSVVVPLTSPTMTVLPPDVVEGDRLYLICGVLGSPPVTFKWYRNGKPLSAANSTGRSESHQIPVAGGQHSGTYHCEATNYANVNVRSQAVTVKVRMAPWKHALIVASCLLVVAVVALLCVLRFKSKRGRREAAAELSVKPSSPKSDDSLTVSLTHDTEVFNEPKDAAPDFDGMEGRVTNGTRDSVTSLPADISNRSSYSIPATV